MNKLFLLVTSLICISLFTSCNEEYFYEENIPEDLGKSIYDYLQNDGNYTNYVRLIDDLDLVSVLSKTGSKTLFVADDAAFEQFYKGNLWGIKKYEDFSLAHKRLMLNSSMLNNAILIEGLSTMEGAVKGQVMRRATALTLSDAIPFIRGSELPENPYWNRFRENGIYLLKDATVLPLLCFTEPLIRAQNITNEDFSILFNGVERQREDAYIYNVKVKKQDIVCQNGYIHVLESVLIPTSNMADVIHDAPETNMFSSFLERYAAPYYAGTAGVDSIFAKGYFASRSAVVPFVSPYPRDPDNKSVTSFLSYDPGWNRYRASDVIGSFQTNMAAMFAPSDAALRTYFEEGGGRALVDRYGSIDAIPDGVLDKLINNHLKTDFLATLPSQFHTVMDDAQEVMGITKANVDKVYLASNGAIYVVNTVFPPALYSSVMFPATINENMKVFNWAIDAKEFDAYLLSMVNYYSFFLPTDNFTYILPTSLKDVEPVAWRFRYNYLQNTVYASVHPYNLDTHEIGDSTAVVTSSSLLLDHLEDMLDYHIVVGNIEDGREFYRTKGGGTIRIARNGNQIHVAGGGDIERNTDVPVVEVYDQTRETNGRGNGKTYVVNEPIQTTTRSVYSILFDEPEFSEFFQLLQGNDDLWVGDSERSVKYSVFYQDASQGGLDYNVRFLSTFHYTLYIPTNDAVREAFQNGLPDWDDVEAETDQDERDALAEKIIRFVRYHFQDNAVFLDVPSISTSYETATLNNNTDTFYKLKLDGGNYSLNITTASDGNASVKKDKGLFNIMARDFKFNTPDPLNATMIETSSHIVIHQIDKCLYFDKNQFKE